MTDQAEPIAGGSAAQLSRRYVLRGVAATGAALAASTLAGCGDSGDGGATSGGTTTPPTSASSTPGQTSSPSASSGGEALAKTSDIPVGGGKIFEAKRIVVTQPQEGDFKGFSAICTHQGCIVSRVEDGVIKCPCHGSQYAIADAAVVAGPAPTPLATEDITVEGDEIFVA